MRIVPHTASNQPSAIDKADLIVKGTGVLKKEQKPDVKCHYFVIERNIPDTSSPATGGKSAGKSAGKGGGKGDKKSSKK